MKQKLMTIFMAIPLVLIFVGFPALLLGLIFIAGGLEGLLTLFGVLMFILWVIEAMDYFTDEKY